MNSESLTQFVRGIKQTPAALKFLALLAFLAPLIGGILPAKSWPLEKGVFVLALFGGTEIPLFTHLLLGSLAVIALVLMLAKRQVLQLPPLWLTSMMFAFFGLLAMSLLFSAFKATSLATLCEWLMYGVTFFATVAAAGRKRGPALLACLIFVACVALSYRGILEYRDMKAIDPTYRIFGGWTHPNALAGMLLIGLFLGIGFLVSAKRINALLAGLGVSVIGLAMLLTASRGGFLAAQVGLVVLVPLVLWQSASFKNGLLAVAKLGAALALVVLFGFLLRAAPRAPAAVTLKSLGAAPPHPSSPELTGPLPRRGEEFSPPFTLHTPRFTLTQAPTPQSPNTSPGSRLTDSSGAQSNEFRKQLWKGAIQMMRQNPLGYGIGAYRYESSRPGLTTQTQYAHQSFLQLGVEATPLAPLCLLLAGAGWIYLMLRGPKKLPEDRRLLRVCVTVAVIATAAHNMVDSNLYCFGIGLTTFMLLGIGLQLSADASAPEFVPKNGRVTALAALLFIVGALFYCAMGEMSNARLSAEMGRSIPDRDAVDAWLGQAKTWAGKSGDTWLNAFRAAKTEDERQAALQTLTQVAPTPNSYRLLARYLREKGDFAGALKALNRAFERDPRNFLGHKLKIEIQAEQGDTIGAADTARRLVSFEDTSYYKIRSIPEMIPVETAFAREYLSGNTGETPEKISWLRGAIEIYLAYNRTTMPQVLSFAKAGSTYNEEGLPQAREKLEQGVKDLSSTVGSEAWNSRDLKSRPH